MIRFNTVNREELKKATELIPDGWYEAEITEAKEETAKSSGNSMLNLTLKVYKPDGSHVMVWDYLVFTDKALWKVAECADACGAGDAYDRGELSGDMLVGNVVQVKIATKAATGEYDAKNIVKSYAATAKPAAPKPSAPKPSAPAPAKVAAKRAVEYGTVTEDQIPF